MKAAHPAGITDPSRKGRSQSPSALVQQRIQVACSDIWWQDKQGSSISSRQRRDNAEVGEPNVGVAQQLQGEGPLRHNGLRIYGRHHGADWLQRVEDELGGDSTIQLNRCKREGHH